jgi:hypothetical protein
MTKGDFVGPGLRSFLTACIALTATTASAASTAVSELPQEFWGKECFGPAPSRTFPGTMWYVLLRVGADGKKVQTWSSYGPPGSETKQSVAAKGFESQGMLFTAWGDGTYIVPVRSPKAILSLFIKLVDNQVQYSTANGVTGKGDCEKLP